VQFVDLISCFECSDDCGRQMVLAGRIRQADDLE
jgi:hypothetical protein